MTLSTSEDQVAPLRLWVLVGATGTGKTRLSLELAQALIDQGRPAEIVNADAMQLYRGMNIGTAKLPHSDRRGIAHHLFDELTVDQDATAAWYQPVARTVIEDIHARGADAILVGGSGLYVSSVIYDFHFPPRNEELRARLEFELNEYGPGALYERLALADAVTAARVDPRNGRRVVRALEVLEQGKQTHGAALPTQPKLWATDTRVYGIAVDRSELVPRLDERVVDMWEQGIVNEARALRDQGIEQGTTAQRAIGYAQALAQDRGEVSEAEAIAQTQSLTRRYARRQVSWFRRYAELSWVPSGTPAADLLNDDTP